MAFFPEKEKVQSNIQRHPSGSRGGRQPKARLAIFILVLRRERTQTFRGSALGSSPPHLTNPRKADPPPVASAGGVIECDHKGIDGFLSLVSPGGEVADLLFLSPSASSLQTALLSARCYADNKPVPLVRMLSRQRSTGIERTLLRKVIGSELHLWRFPRASAQQSVRGLRDFAINLCRDNREEKCACVGSKSTPPHTHTTTTTSTTTTPQQKNP
ncbi:unnamed protein product [Pleuronectes platessa]|uniref:Uncharacterized protein n=1 Tax=Pleuronectes platessa TaxID=8262 RepID=A0A9N7TQC4_PLEPL|nr:unnamed protein product [Pleuronectes platessa]